MQEFISQVTVEIDNVPKVNADSSAVGNALSTTFIAVGAISILFILIGGFKYITSAGDPSQVASAKNTILYALIGIVISLSAFAIVQLVVGELSS